MLIGITGGFATGKTTVAKMFAKLGCHVIDADKVGHELLKNDLSVYKKVVKAFGSDILIRRKISRRKLAMAAFADRTNLNKLSDIMHPIIIKSIKRHISKAKNSHRYIAIDAPLLFETDLHRIADKTVVVVAKRIDQIRRAVDKFSITKAQALTRISCQMDLNKKAGLADFIIYNSGSLNSTRKQAKTVFKKISSQRG